MDSCLRRNDGARWVGMRGEGQPGDSIIEGLRLCFLRRRIFDGAKGMV